jgi:hypothetical protein
VKNPVSKFAFQVHNLRRYTMVLSQEMERFNKLHKVGRVHVQSS